MLFKKFWDFLIAGSCSFCVVSENSVVHLKAWGEVEHHVGGKINSGDAPIIVHN